MACMFTAHQLRTYTTAHLSGGGWYLDYTLEFTPPSEVQLRRSLDGKGILDLDIDEFVGLEGESTLRPPKKYIRKVLFEDVFI